MKKLLAIILSALMAFAFPLTVLAANGPMGSINLGDGDFYLSYVSLLKFDENGAFLGTTTVFDGENSYNTTDGISYDKASNTLSLNNFNSSDAIQTNVMGDDFKINVSGSCSLGQIQVWGDHYGGSLTIEGSGTLTVNENKRYENAIVLNAEESDSALNFGEDVKVNLYAQTDTVNITATSNDNALTAISFGNGQTANVSKQPYVKVYGEYINGLYLSDTDTISYGGQRAICASDPGGVYTVTTGYYNSNPDQTIYWVNKYFYVESFDAYTEDYGFGDFGSIEMTEEDFKNQTEFTVKMTQADYPESIQYYEKDNLDADYSYSVNKVTNASDPDGVYGYNTYYMTDSEGNVIGEGIYINRFVLADGTDKYIVDESFEQLNLTNDEFESSEYSIVYAMESEWLEWNGRVNKNTYSVYKDENSNKYAVDYVEAVYDYVGKDIVNIGGTDYYCVTENNTVSLDSLEESIINETVNGYYSYTLSGTEFIYTGNGSQVTPISNATVSGITSKTYTGKALTQSITVKLNGKTLTRGTDYTVAYKNNINVGTATVVITGKGNYSGQITKTFKITAKKITPTVSLSGTSYTYDSKVKTPSVTVKDSNGKTLVKNTDYTVSYASGRKLVGKYAVKVTLKGNYSGSKTVYFSIKPKSTSISSLTAGSKKFTVKWKKQATQTTGYQIQYSTSSKFSNAKTVTISKNSTTSKTISSLSAKKKYYVRVRTYKVVNGTKYYSGWSSTKSVTTNK
ncbi:MAG: fibronectin type III domain-containing protein [Eubacterium sp.]